MATQKQRGEGLFCSSPRGFFDFLPNFRLRVGRERIGIGFPAQLFQPVVVRGLNKRRIGQKFVSDGGQHLGGKEHPLVGNSAFSLRHGLPRVGGSSGGKSRRVEPPGGADPADVSDVCGGVEGPVGKQKIPDGKGENRSGILALKIPGGPFLERNRYAGENGFFG